MKLRRNFFACYAPTKPNQTLHAWFLSFFLSEMSQLSSYLSHPGKKSQLNTFLLLLTGKYNILLSHQCNPTVMSRKYYPCQTTYHSLILFPAGGASNLCTIISVSFHQGDPAFFLHFWVYHGTSARAAGALGPFPAPLHRCSVSDRRCSQPKKCIPALSFKHMVVRIYRSALNVVPWLFPWQVGN